MLVTIYVSILLLNKYMSCIYQLPTRFVPSSYHVRIFPLAIEANRERKRYEHGATGIWGERAGIYMLFVEIFLSMQN